MRKILRILFGVLIIAIGAAACNSTPAPTEPAPPTIPEPTPEPEPLPFITLQNGQAASVVIGQDDFDSNGPHPDSDKAFSMVFGTPLVADGVLYLPDDGAGRVMGYKTIPTTNGAAADFVLGKIDFDGGQAGLSSPGSVFTDGENVFVSDFDFNRIVRFDGFPTTSGVEVSLAIGQPDLTSSDVRCSADGLTEPDGAIIADGKLIVADSDNNRVLIWNSVPTSFNESADLVLGQVDMTTCDYHLEPTGRTIWEPRDVWSDGTKLLIVDGDANRVLGWNEFPTEHNTPADFVLGQTTFDADSSGTGADKLNNPSYIDSNGTQVFLADTSNNRVLVWNEFPTENGQAADLVLGQVDFEMNDANFGFLTTNKYGFHEPTGVLAYDNLLIVGDLVNNRYLIFEGE